MSAGSPRQPRAFTRNKLDQTIVSPQQVTDPSILDSVAGFINEVATYNAPFDTKDQIQWVRFENFNCDTPLEIEEGEGLIPIAIVLILGYTTGIQVWAIPANGEAAELIAWRHGSVRVLKFLPSPYRIGCNTLKDIYAQSRPLIALCDSTTPGPHYCALSFISLKSGEQVKVIKFKNPILDVMANQHSIVVTFSERIAVFDAFTLEDRLTITTCYLSPGLYPNPVALGIRWLAYAEKTLISNKRSNGGNEGEGVQSYTATVIHAAKSLGKGLRELGETVASSLTGNSTFKPGSPGSSQSGGNSPLEAVQKGVVTVIDIENHNTDEGVIAHFAAHSDAIVCLSFDPSGMLLLTADKRGHDFHLFRIHPHPAGSSLAAVHHLYILHRGDTTARVQDMCFSPDSRWVAVSTLRGTTHVFPVTPYGGNVGYRTHGTPFVVNRMSRFHRSAGLPAEGRSNSPVSLSEIPILSSIPYNNPRLSPFPHPTVVHPLAQIRQPLFIQVAGNLQHRPHTVIGRPRLNSSSEDNIQVALRISACFASSRAWFDNLAPSHETLSKQQTKAMESLFIMSCHGNLIQYDLDPHRAASVSKEKKCCDESPIELTIQAKAQWTLQRQSHWNDTPLPVNPQKLNILPPLTSKKHKNIKHDQVDDQWLSQVEIVTHAGPHRRLWMGPQFTFKTYTNGSPLSYDGQSVEIGHSKPVNMPTSTTYPILIESGSTSSCEQSPKLLDTYQKLAEVMGGAGELQLKEDLADAMLESPGIRETGGRCVIVSMKPHSAGIAKVVNPLGTVVTIHSDEDAEIQTIEEGVIHENCDEALFRPVVAPKPFHFIEYKPSFPNKPSVLKTRNSISEPLGKDLRAKSENNRKHLSSGNNEKCLKVTESQEIKVRSDVRLQNKFDAKYQFKKEIIIDTDQSGLVPKRIKPEIEKNEKVQKSDSCFEDMNTKSAVLNIYNAANENIPPKMLITTPDLMDTIDDFTFSANTNIQRKTEPVPITSSDELFKEDNFEDARDSPEVTVKIELPKFNNKYQGLEPDEVVLLPDEGKNGKKQRKPKSKLGVRLGSKIIDGFEKIEKEIDTNISVEVTLPAPRKSWSTIVGSKPIEDPIVEMPLVEHVELPIKSYSMVAKKQIELDPNDDTYALLPDKISKPNNAKLSDDEIQGTVSSQNETTESDDSVGKVIVMDTEEDHCQSEVATKHVQQGPEKLVKRKSKRKKK